ncbi:MAG: Dyp-type peroxidase [Pyrinomonadaceae bacterium]|nr:Dyp-type peroxidase [Pyrinomonadaceae bacterium]
MEETRINLKEEIFPIDPEDKKYERMLANLQGNILKSHGRKFAVHLFLTFLDDPDPMREWISEFAARYVTSALRQHYETKEFKLSKISRLFAGFYLSAEGYRALGFTEEELEEKFDGSETADDNDPRQVDVSFRDGMPQGRSTLGDPPAGEWETNFLQNRIDALIQLADDDTERLEDAVRLIGEWLEVSGIRFFQQDGKVLFDKESNKQIEHFGFRDGISQPVFYYDDVLEAGKNGDRNWNPFAPLKLALVKDPLTEAEDCFGSYLVFRKLEQNVQGFYEEGEALAAALTGKEKGQLTGKEKDLAAALVVGRFRNGLPLMMSDDMEQKTLIDYNNFNYFDNKTRAFSENKCPVHAHIRRVNPRGEADTNEKEAMHRIIRRGIPYGDPGDEEVGLLFMCFQSSIPRQFGFIQSRWANVSAFLGRESSGLDPIIGRNKSIEEGSEERKQKWLPVWGGNGEPVAFEFKSFVTLKGGEFFFAPSIAFLQSFKKKT